jgi:hypothetical protein
LLKTTIETAVAIGAVTKREFERVIVDTTVQEKAIAYPTDSRLLEVARARSRWLAKRAGVALKQTYEREGKPRCAAVRRLRARQAVQAPEAACSNASARSWDGCCAMCAASWALMPIAAAGLRCG